MFVGIIIDKHFFYWNDVWRICEIISFT